MTQYMAGIANILIYQEQEQEKDCNMCGVFLYFRLIRNLGYAVFLIFFSYCVVL